MADEEIVSGLKRVENQVVQHRQDDSGQTNQLNDTINNLRIENSKKSDNLANVITTGLERNASELASDRAIQEENQSFLRESGVTRIDDKIDDLTSETASANTEQRTFLQRIATFVNPNMQGSKDRERDVENKLRFDTQLKFFKNMAKSLKDMVVSPIRATASTISTFMKSLAFGGALLALLAFLDSDMWKDWQKIIVEELPKKLIAIKDAFVDKEGNVTFLNGLKELGVQLGIWDKGIEGIKDSISNSGIAASILGISIGIATLGKMFKGIRGSMFGAGLMGAAAGAPKPKFATAAEGFKGVGGADPLEQARGTVKTSGGTRPVVMSAAGNWTFAGADMKPTTEVVPKELQENVKVDKGGGKGPGTKSGLGRRALGILRGIPYIGRFLSIVDLLDIIDSNESIEKKTQGIIGIIGGLGGSMLGGLVGTGRGAAMGLGFFSKLTGLVGGGLGAWVGYTYGDELAQQAVAQYLLGEKVTAYDGVIDNWKSMFGMGSGGQSADILGGGGGASALIGSEGAANLATQTETVSFIPTERADITPPAIEDIGGNLSSIKAASEARKFGGNMAAAPSNIVAPTSNIVNNNQSTTNVAAKKISNDNPIIRAVSFAI